MANKKIILSTTRAATNSADYTDSSNSNSSNAGTYLDVSMKAKRKFNTTSGTTSLHIDKNVDVVAIKNSIKNIFTWVRGERVLDPNFGSALQHLLYEPITADYSTEQITAEIKDVFSRYEPRAALDKIIVTPLASDQTENNTVELEIFWHAVASVNEQNQNDNAQIISTKIIV